MPALSTDPRCAQRPSPPTRALLLLLLLAAGCVARDVAPSAGAPATYGAITLRGTINYDQRVMLPPNAVVRVQIIDTAAAEAPVVAEQVIATHGAQAPFPFSVTVPAGVLTPAAIVILRARIEVDGQLRFINPTPYPVSPRSLTRALEIHVEPVTAR